jgi:hypothetical protein
MFKRWKRRQKTWQEVFQQDKTAEVRLRTRKLPEAWAKMERCGFRHILDGGGNWQKP